MDNYIKLTVDLPDAETLAMLLVELRLSAGHDGRRLPQMFFDAMNSPVIGWKGAPRTEMEHYWPILALWLIKFNREYRFEEVKGVEE